MDAFNRRDLEQFMVCYDENVVMEDGAGHVVMQGHDALRAFQERLFRQSPELHCQVLSQMRAGSYVVFDEYTTGLHAEGYPSELHNIAVYRVDGNKITHFRFLM